MSTRPNRRSEQVVAEALKKLLPDVMAWLKRYGADDTEEERKGVLKDLTEAARWADADGYELAKRLDQSGWMPDAKLVEILDGFLSRLLEAKDAAIREWLPSSGLVAPAVGATVTCKTNSGSYTGAVLSVDPNLGVAVVCVASLGHTPVPGPKGGTRGFVIAWEDMVVVSPEN